MKQPRKIPLAAQGIRQPLTWQARHATQPTPVVAQLKTGVPAQKVKPVAPPVYRPQAPPKAAQPRMAINVRAKMAGSLQMKSHPVAPSAYRPQPVPKVLQTKLVSQSNPTPSSRQFAAQRANVATIRKERPNTVHNGRSGAFVPRIVQRKLVYLAGTEYLNPRLNHIPIAGYAQTLEEAEQMDPVITVRAGVPSVGVAKYTFDSLEFKGEITIRPIAPPDLAHRTREYTDRLIAMAHETRHGIDDLTRTVRYRRGGEERIHTEWRAFATQSATAFALIAQGQDVSDRFRHEMASYANKQAFTDPGSAMTGVTKSYMIHYGLNNNPSDQDIADFMRRHDDWVDEALALYRRLLPRQVDQQVAQNLRPPGADNTWWTRGLIIIAGAVLVASIALLLKKYYGLGK